MHKTLILSHTWVVDRTSTWEDAVSDVLSGRADVVEVYADHPIQLGDAKTFPRPAIIRFKNGNTKAPRKRVRFSASALYVRDLGRCQYCDVELNRKNRTVDHIVPRSQGGKTTWENVALSCGPCNHRKADRTPDQSGMNLLRPWLVGKPSPDYISRKSLEVEIGRAIPPEWEPWLQ